MYFWATYIHIIFAMLWIGGMLFTAMILVPASRRPLFDGKRGEFFQIVGTLFSKSSWMIFVIMIITGIAALLGKGFSADQLMNIEFWRTAYGKILMSKLNIFVYVLLISAIHDFWLGPKAVRLMDEMPGDKKTERYKKITSWVGRINLVLGLIILYYASSLVRGLS
ncbi:MAG TPA: DUF4149 domain-containing protein [Balneolaceae bacterium]|nr:DUF4149 domain-containing protein [Balneolaceae bacterium]